MRAWVAGLLLLSTVSFAGDLEWLPETGCRNRIIETERWISENEFQLIRVTSDAMKGSLDIRAVVNAQDELLGLLYITEKGSILKYDLEQISQGADLVKDGSRSVVKIVGTHLSTSGGTLSLVYLQDGMKGSYSKFPMTISSQNGWEMRTEGRKFPKMFLRANRFFGQLIGFSEVLVYF